MCVYNKYNSVNKLWHCAWASKQPCISIKHLYISQTNKGYIKKLSCENISYKYFFHHTIVLSDFHNRFYFTSCCVMFFQTSVLKPLWHSHFNNCWITIVWHLIRYRLDIQRNPDMTDNGDKPLYDPVFLVVLRHMNFK